MSIEALNSSLILEIYSRDLLSLMCTLAILIFVYRSKAQNSYPHSLEWEFISKYSDFNCIAIQINQYPGSSSSNPE